MPRLLLIAALALFVDVKTVIAQVRAGAPRSTDTASAQAPPAAPSGLSGMQIALGAGSGAAALTCDGCDGSSENATVPMVRIGYALTPQSVWGIEYQQWLQDTNATRTTIGFGNLTFQGYPMLDVGFFIKGGFGFGTIKTEALARASATDVSTFAIGGIVGIGYDLGGPRSLALTPYVDLMSIAKADAKVNGVPIGASVGATMVLVGIALTIR